MPENRQGGPLGRDGFPTELEIDHGAFISVQIGPERLCVPAGHIKNSRRAGVSGPLGRREEAAAALNSKQRANLEWNIPIPKKLTVDSKWIVGEVELTLVVKQQAADTGMTIKIKNMLSEATVAYESKWASWISGVAETNLTKSSKNFAEFNSLAKLKAGGARQRNVLMGKGGKLQKSQPLAELLPVLAFGVKLKWESAAEFVNEFLDRFGLTPLLEKVGVKDLSTPTLDLKAEVSTLPIVIQPTFACNFVKHSGIAANNISTTGGVKIKFAFRPTAQWCINVANALSKPARAAFLSLLTKHPELMTKLGWAGRAAGKAFVVVSIVTTAYDVGRLGVEVYRYLELEDEADKTLKEVQAFIRKHIPKLSISPYAKVYAHYVFVSGSNPDDSREVEVFKNACNHGGLNSQSEYGRLKQKAWNDFHRAAYALIAREDLRTLNLTQSEVYDVYREFIKKQFSSKIELEKAVERGIRKRYH